METRSLQPTSWLAQRLGLSITTIERLRMAGSKDLPPAILIGASFRYDQDLVEAWIASRMNASAQASTQQQQGDDDVQQP